MKFRVFLQTEAPSDEGAGFLRGKKTEGETDYPSVLPYGKPPPLTSGGNAGEGVYDVSFICLKSDFTPFALPQGDKGVCHSEEQSDEESYLISTF